MTESVFITGIAGFIGRALAASFKTDQATVKGLARQATDLPGCQVVAGDVETTNLDLVAGSCESVIHLAAPTLGAEIHARPLDAMRINVRGVLNALTAFARGDGKHFLLVSTGKVYGRPLHLPIDEQHPLNPDTALGRSKMECERLVSFYAENLPEKRFSILRLFNAYGPGQRNGMLIPWIISQAADKNGGGKIVLGNVTPKRDFIFIDDVVTAIQAISGGNPGAAGAAEIFNIGSGVSASPGDIVNMLAQITGKKLEIVSEESRVRKGEADEERAGISALAKIGWTPLIALPDGLERTWQKTKK